jgi:hypothetical protein
VNRIARRGRRFSVVLLAVFLASAGGAAGKQGGNGGSEDWPAAEKIDPRGRPQGQIHDKASRFYVFRTGNQWHVVTTSTRGKSKPPFAGEITVDQATIKAAVPVGLEARDAVKLNAEHQTLTFQFRTGTKADGFYFVVSPEVERIRFDLKPPGETKPRRRIFIGPEKANPSRFPFVLEVPKGQ